MEWRSVTVEDLRQLAFQNGQTTDLSPLPEEKSPQTQGEANEAVPEAEGLLAEGLEKPEAVGVFSAGAEPSEVAAVAVESAQEIPAEPEEVFPVPEEVAVSAQAGEPEEEDAVQRFVEDDFLAFLRRDEVTVSQVAEHPEFLAAIREGAGKPLQNLVLGNEDFSRQTYQGDKAKARNNLAAIRLLKALQTVVGADQEKPAIPAAWQETLSRFVGWGGLPQMFQDSQGNYGKGYEKLGESLRSLLTEEEYETARRTTLDAHYTSVFVVDGMWKTLQKIGIRRDSLILEPSVGSGVFLGKMPEELRKESVVVGCELDSITAGIASWCHGSAKIENLRYEVMPVLRENAVSSDLDRHGFDVVIGNPPFGNQKVRDALHPEWSDAPNIHSYFFEKSLHQLRPRGVMAMVVSRYLLDAGTQEHENWRKEFALQADLLGAVRLPNTAFAKNAGTEVVTDILVFQRREKPLAEHIGDLADEQYPSWVFSVEDMAFTQDGKPIPGSRYYQEHPEAILGTPSLEGTMYRANEPTVLPDERFAHPEQIPELLQAALLEQMAGQEPTLPDLPSLDLALFREEGESGDIGPLMRSIAKHYQQGSWFFFQDEQGKEHLARREERFFWGANAVVEKGEVPDSEEDTDSANGLLMLSASQIRRIKGMCEIRDQLKILLELQVSPTATEEEIERARDRLNTVYDGFVKQHGYLRRRINERLFAGDPASGSLRTLEVDYQPEITAAVARRTGEERRPESAEKAKIFFQRTQFPYQEPDQAATPMDALRLSLGQRGRVEPEYMVSLVRKGGWRPEAGKPVDWQVIREVLGEEILLDPDTQNWGVRNLVLSGVIADKIDKASAHAQRYPEGSAQRQEWERTQEALREAIPERVVYSQIGFRLGTPWVPVQVIDRFVSDTFGGSLKVEHLPELGKWNVSGAADVSLGERWSAGTKTGHVKAEKILTTVLNDQPAIIRQTIAGKQVVHEEDSELLRSRCVDLRKEWESWLENHQEAQDEIEEAFNARFNQEVLPKYRGDHLDLPGSSSAITLRPQQKNVIWRGLMGNNLLMDHAVGAGKTFAAVALAMEMRRTGRAAKPLLVVPGHLVEQWQESFLTLYPNAKVLSSGKEDRDKKGRQEFLARAAYGDWDAVIVAHSTFGKIPADPEDEKLYYEKEISIYRQALSFYNARNDKRGVKQMERKIVSYQAKLDRKRESRSFDAGLLHMGNIGFDALVVDEVQEFKNLPFTTQLKNVSGLGNPEGSERATGLYIKVQGINRKRDGKGGVFFLTGTPLSNTMAEMYIWQRYLDSDYLVEKGLLTFDAWKDTFASVTREYGFTLTGDYKERAYLGKFENWPELLKMLDRFKDSVTISDVQRMMEEAGQGTLPIPPIANGAPEVISVEPTTAQMHIIGVEIGEKEDGTPVYNADSIMNRLDNLPKRPGKGEDNILSLANELMKVGLDVRAFTKKQNDEDEGENGRKLIAATEKMLQIYQQWQEDRGTQLVFLDFSTPKSSKKLNPKDQKALEAMTTLRRLEGKEKTDDLTEEDIADREKCEELLDGYSPTELEELLSSSDTEIWSAYAEMRDMLIRRGVPESEIAFIHDTPDDKKQDLFSKVRSGRIRFLFGSSSKMGAGMNVQDRLVGVHHLDAPYRPLDLEQRNGRILRQGNKLLEKHGPDNFAVHVCYYVTEGSGDPGRWQILEFKKRFIDQSRVPLDASSGLRVLEDPASKALDPAKVKAEASGSKVLMDRVELADLVKQGERELQAAKSVQLDLQRRYRMYAARVQNEEAWIAALESLRPSAETWLRDVEDRVQAYKDAKVADKKTDAKDARGEDQKKEVAEPVFPVSVFDTRKEEWVETTASARDIGKLVYEQVLPEAKRFFPAVGGNKFDFDKKKFRELPLVRIHDKNGQEIGELAMIDAKWDSIDQEGSVHVALLLPEAERAQSPLLSGGNVYEKCDKYHDYQFGVAFDARALASREYMNPEKEKEWQSYLLRRHTFIGKKVVLAPEVIMEALQQQRARLQNDMAAFESVQKELSRQETFLPELQKKARVLEQEKEVLDLLEKALRCGVRKYEKVDDRIAGLESSGRTAQETVSFAGDATDDALEAGEKSGEESSMEENPSQETTQKAVSPSAWKLDTLVEIREPLLRWATEREEALENFKAGEEVDLAAVSFLEEDEERPEGESIIRLAE